MTESNSAIRKAAGLTVPGHSMILPGTVPETPISHEWEPSTGMVSEIVHTGECLAGTFVNSTVNGQFLVEEFIL